MSNDVTNIYWSPIFESDPNDLEINWGILYPDPINLYNTLRLKMDNTEPSKNMFYCPSFKGLTSNIFVFNNPMDADFCLDDSNKLSTKNKKFVTIKIAHEPSIKNSLLFEYGLKWIFFAEDSDIDVTITSPYFDTPNHLTYGNIVPGRFSISNWFRTINAEFNLKSGVRQLKIEKDEPILYVTFNTNKKINLIRFDMNKSLIASKNACSTSADWESWVPLAARYKRFKESRMKESILREIKKNIVGISNDNY